MGEQHQLAADFVADRAGYTTDPVKNLRTGVVFTAEIDGSPAPEIVLTELGEDYRNVVLLHVTDDTEAARINAQDRVQFTLFGKLSTAQIIKRRDNPASPQNDFWAMQLTEKDS
jgi:hypothetical protein